ncbi:hypothetical protein HZA42_00055 [Candidatus Peregrinibacteria bacterium]|nr:hypothetical protein [Candidatus Peregrinibacteria bacterium]
MNTKINIFVGLLALVLCVGGLKMLQVETASAAVPIPSKYYPEGAATISGQKPVPGQNELSGKDPVGVARYAIMYRIISWILRFAGVIAVFFIAQNGWKMAASGGKEESITEGKKGLTWAVIGLILIILSYSIVRFVAEIPFRADESSQGTPQGGGGSSG